MIEYQKEQQKCDDPKRKKELETLIKRAYNNQQVRKIALNSAYGALANQYFAFFSIDLAERLHLVVSCPSSGPRKQSTNISIKS